MVTKGESLGGVYTLVVWDWYIHLTIIKLDDQQGPTVEQRKLNSIFCNNLNGKRIWKRIDVCITKPFYCTSETITTLSVNYTPKWDKVLK